MPQIIIHVDPDYGNNAESGRSPKHPKQSLEGALATNPTPGTIIALRMDTIHTGSAATKDQAYTMKTNGVTLTSYATGSEQNRAPILVYPRVAQLPAGYKSVILGILGNDNVVSGLDFWSADIHIQTFQTHLRNWIQNCRSFDFGFGIVDKASYTTISDCYFYRGHMLRDGGDDAAGAMAIVLERYKDFAHIGTRIYRIFAEMCMAPSVRYKPFDGSMFEISGGIEDVIIANCIGLDLKIFLEVGGQTALRQTISNVLFQNNLIVNSMKGAAYFNNPTEAFYADIDNMRFISNTFIQTDPVSAFFFAGDQKDISKKFTARKNIVVGASSIYGTSKEGGSDISGLIRNDDTIRNPDFFNPGHGDYRLARTADHDAGALNKVALSARRTTSETGGITASVPSWADMNAIPPQMRGRCRIPRYRLEYEWNPIVNKWLKVGSYTPPEPK